MLLAFIYIILSCFPTQSTPPDLSVAGQLPGVGPWNLGWGFSDDGWVDGTQPTEA